MKVQDLERKHPPFDVASGLAEIMLKRGEVVQVIPEAKPKRVPDVHFYTCREDTRTVDFEKPPALTWRCNTCSQAGLQKGPNAHKLPVHCQCGTTPIPEKIGADYQAALAAYNRRFKRNTKPVVVAPMDPARVRAILEAKMRGLTPAWMTEADRAVFEGK